MSIDTTQPPLPTGAATSAKQAAPGITGSPSADVTTIQGGPGAVPVPVDGSTVVQPVTIVSDPTQPLPVAGRNVDDIVAVGGIPIPQGQGVPVSVQGTVPVSLPAPLPVSDSVLEAVLGSQTDQAAYGPVASSLMAQLKGLNDAHQTLIVLLTQHTQLLQAILQAINSVAGQLGAAPASVNSAASTQMN